MLPRFLSRKRKCYGDYERKQILEAVEDIDPDTFATSEELDAAKAQIGALQKQIDDNDGDDDQTAAFAKAGLGLGVTGFVFGAAALAVALTKKHAVVAKPSVKVSEATVVGGV